MMEIESSSTSYVVYKTQKANNYLGSLVELRIRLFSLHTKGLNHQGNAILLHPVPRTARDVGVL